MEKNEHVINVTMSSPEVKVKVKADAGAGAESVTSYAMMDYTDMLQSDPDQFPYDNKLTNVEDPFDDATKITIEMLRKRPDIRKAILEVLNDMLVPWEDDEEDEPDDFIDQQLVSAMNLDPFIQTSVFECLNGLGDVTEDEGEEMFFQSIFNYDSVEEITTHMKHGGGFREDYEGVPAKYVHLSDHHQNMIYTNPEARKFLSKMESELITEEFVEQLCKK
jgi:hypothetical protein